MENTYDRSENANNNNNKILELASRMIGSPSCPTSEEQRGLDRDASAWLEKRREPAAPAKNRQKISLDFISAITIPLVQIYLSTASRFIYIYVCVCVCVKNSHKN